MIAGNMLESDWAQRYRPVTLKDCVLPSSIRKTLQRFVSRGVIENLIFHGQCGIGKTSSAKALCRDVDVDLLEVNGSDQTSVVDFRKTVKQFAHSLSLRGKDVKKVVLIDEAENLTRHYHAALRSFMEDVSINCSFVLTTNYLHRISEGVQNRCLRIDFSVPEAEVETLQLVFTARLKAILEQERVSYHSEVLARIVALEFPCFRQILKQAQVACGL